MFIYKIDTMSDMPRRHLAVDERREEIFRHASQVFASRGFAGTKIADIALAAGMSQGLLYRYFASKDALFTALIAASFARLAAATEALEKMPLPAHEKIALAIEHLLSDLAADPAFSERVLLVAQASFSEQIPEATKAVILAERGKPYAAIARIMAAGQAEGSISPGAPEMLAILFWTTIKGLALHKAAFGEKFEMPDKAILCRMFLASQPAQPRQGDIQ